MNMQVAEEWPWGAEQQGIWPGKCSPYYQHITVLAAYVKSRTPRLFTHPRHVQGEMRLCKTILKLCGENIDDVTLILNTFSAWQACPKRERHVWCSDNLVDFSVMKQIESLIMTKPLVQASKSPEPGTSSDITSHLPTSGCPHLGVALLRALPNNLYVFLGHRKLGYINVNSGKVYRVSGDSVLNLRETFPQYVIDVKPLKTDGKYLSMTYVITTNDISVVLGEEKLCEISESLQGKLVKPYIIPNLGFRTTQKICKDRSALIGILSRETACPQDLIYIEVEETTHEASAFMPEEYHSDRVKTAVASYLWELRSEEAARVLHVPYPVADSPVTVHIGAGGEILHISAPNDKTKPMLLFYNDSKNSQLRVPPDMTQFDNSRLAKVMQDSRLLDTVQPADRKHAGLFWGVANMRRMPVSQSLMENVLRWEHGDHFLVVPLEDRLEVEYRLKFHWRRRKEIFYKPEIHFLDSYYYRRAKRTWNNRPHHLVQATFYDDRHKIKLRPKNSKEKESRVVSHVRKAIYDLTRGVSHREFEINYAVLPAFASSEEDLKRYRTSILEQLAGRVGDPLTAGDDYTYDVVIETPADEDIRCYGYVLTTSSDLAFFLESHLVTPFVVDDCPVRWNGGRAHALFTLSPEVLDVCWDALVKKKVHWQRQAGVYILIKEQDTQVQVEVYVESYDHDLLQTISEDVLMVVASNTVVFLESPTEMQHALLTNTVHDIMTATNTHVHISEENMEITVYGEESVRTRAAEQIREALEEVSRDKEHFMYLPLGQRMLLPISLLKLCTKFGSELQILKQESGCQDVHIERCRGYLVCKGGQESLDHARRLVQDCLGDVTPSIVNMEQVECVACLCPVGARPYQLEWCGHVYCADCLQLQTQTSLRSNIFPILCAADSCCMPLTVADLLYGNALADGKDENLAEAALKLFLPQNRARYRPCPTADCRGVFPLATNAERFTCAACEKSLCTACLTVPFHEGLSCGVHQAMHSVEPLVKAWIARRPRLRKMCPRCLNGIEKVGGCNHVDCAVCRAQICWRCLRYFDTTFAVYQHSHEHRDLERDDDDVPVEEYEDEELDGQAPLPQ